MQFGCLISSRCHNTNDKDLTVHSQQCVHLAPTCTLLEAVNLTCLFNTLHLLIFTSVATAINILLFSKHNILDSTSIYVLLCCPCREVVISPAKDTLFREFRHKRCDKTAVSFENEPLYFLLGPIDTTLYRSVLYL